jgi:hypothetical protein
MKQKKWKKRNQRQVERRTPDESKVIGCPKTPAVGITDHLKYLRKLKHQLINNPKGTPLRKRDRIQGKRKTC